MDDGWWTDKAEQRHQPVTPGLDSAVRIAKGSRHEPSQCWRQAAAGPGRLKRGAISPQSPARGTILGAGRLVISLFGRRDVSFTATH